MQRPQRTSKPSSSLDSVFRTQIDSDWMSARDSLLLFRLIQSVLTIYNQSLWNFVIRAWIREYVTWKMHVSSAFFLSRLDGPETRAGLIFIPFKILSVSPQWPAALSYRTVRPHWRCANGAPARAEVGPAGAIWQIGMLLSPTIRPLTTSKAIIRISSRS